MLHDPSKEVIIKIRDSKVTKMLMAAAELIKKGWTQHAFHRSDEDDGDMYCMLGALEESYASRTSYNKAVRLLHKALPKSARRDREQWDARAEGRAFCDIMQYNDVDGRRKSTIVKVFTKAIEYSRM